MLRLSPNKDVFFNFAKMTTKEEIICPDDLSSNPTHPIPIHSHFSNNNLLCAVIFNLCGDRAHG